MKTVVVSSLHIFVSHFILGSPFWELLKADKGIRIILLVPKGKGAFFEEYFGGERVVVEEIAKRGGRFLSLLSDFGISALRTRSVAIRKRRGGIGWVYKYSPRLFFFAPYVKAIYPWLYAFLTPGVIYAELFERYKPDLVFSADIFSYLDTRLMLEARAKNIPVVGMVRSWDNLTTKGVFRVVPDVLVVSNEIEKEEALTFHHMPAEKIQVVGIPIYDRYLHFREQPPHSREMFYKRIGADPAKRIVLFSPMGDRFFQKNTFDRDLIEILSENLPSTHQLLVRFPPADSVNLAGLKSLKNVIYDRPGVQLSSDSTFYKKNELTPHDDDHLIDTLQYSDVIVVISTTLAIDAVVFDRPMVVIGFDSAERQITSSSPAQALEYNHIQPFLASGGVKVAKNPAELALFIERYIENPTLDAEGRDRLRNEQCFATDGHSSERLISVIKSVLK